MTAVATNTNHPIAGEAIEALRAAVRGAVVTPDDPGYGWSFPGNPGTMFADPALPGQVHCGRGPPTRITPGLTGQEARLPAGEAGRLMGEGLKPPMSLRLSAREERSRRFRPFAAQAALNGHSLAGFLYAFGQKSGPNPTT